MKNSDLFIFHIEYSCLGETICVIQLAENECFISGWILIINSFANCLDLCAQ